MKCIIHDCPSIISPAKSKSCVSSHRFPTSVDILERWMCSIKMFTGQILSIDKCEKSRICDKHFRPEQFKFKGSRMFLDKGAVPTVFDKTPIDETDELEFITDECLSADEIAEMIVPRKKIRLDCETKYEEKIDLLTVRKVVEEAKKEVKQKKNAGIRLLQQKCRRLERRVESVLDVLNNARDRNMLSQTATDQLFAKFGGNEELMRELLMHKKSQSYSKTVKCFAVTLHYYSPRAYQYVRERLSNSLPTTRTVISWYSSVDGDPGLTSEAIAILQRKAEEAITNGKRLLVNLMMDEVAIRRHVEWNDAKKQFEGSVELAGFLPEGEDVLPMAKEALVFMVTSATESWKIPIGYFLIDGLDADQKANLVETILQYLANINVTVISLIFDGPSTNISTANKLGACLKYGPNFRTYFNHPVTEEPVFIILDVCHMLKLVRNTLGAKKQLKTTDGMVEWKYIELLNNMQQVTGHPIAGKLSNRHVNFENEKMRVDLAAQTLSRSVAESLDTLRSTSPDFCESKPTADFIKTVNDLFDVFNSKHAEAVGYKQPITASNFEEYCILFDEAEQLISTLEIQQKKDGKMVWQPILTSINKTGFLGFIVAIHSFKEMFKLYFVEKSEIDVLVCYRMSQDHLETFFSKIRSRGGNNNNPTSIQFKAAYKRLIVNNNIRPSTSGNCFDFTEIKTLHVENKRQFYLNVINQRNDEDIAVQLDTRMEINRQDLNDHINDDSILDYSLARTSILVQKHLIEKVKCEDCLQELKSSNTGAHSDVQAICKISEQEFKALVGADTKLNIPKYYFALTTKIATTIFEQTNVFHKMSDHIINQDALSNHRNMLVNLCIDFYLQLRIHHYVKGYGGFKPTQRKKLNKIVLFQGD